MRWLFFLGTLIALVPTAAAAPILSVTAPAPVIALAADGSRVAYAAGFSAGDCNRVRLWNLDPVGVTRLGRGTSCVRTSTGTAITSLALAGRRALWLHVTGGNIREWSLWTATGHLPVARRLRMSRADADDPAPIVLGSGDSTRLGGILPYAVGRTVTALRVNGSRRFTWTAPARVVALAASEGVLAVAVEGGRVIVLDDNGLILRTEEFARTAEVVRLTPNALLVQSGRSLELRENGGARFYSLIAGVRLADANDDHAILVGGGKVRRLELGSRSGAVIASGALATLAGAQVAVASGRRVRFYPLP
ncbi:MAG: hypothetical protein MSC30_12195 [Gaiellaceae bacterium MAG52_C11]|nr:hypothetical protein [Candidatus Gaiellasilicea maunaloa]